MSRSKKPIRRTETVAPIKQDSAAPRRRFRWLLIGGVGIVAAAATYWLLESPQAYYRSARRLLAQNPERCGQLAEQAIIKAGGDYPAAQLLQCQALAATGEWDAALGGFSLIKNPKSCPGESLLDLAAKAFQANQFQLADLAIRAARVPGASYSQATELLIRLKLRFQLRDEALQLCREWQTAAADTPMPWVIAAEIEVSQFELAAAITDYREALRRSPAGDLENSIHAGLARLLTHTGDVAAARFHFEKLLKSGPLPATIRLEYVQLLRLEGRSAEAMAEVEKFLTEAGPDAEALKRRGQIHLDLGQLELALADLQAAAAGNNDDIATHHLLAQVYLRQGNPDQAKPHLEKSRRLTSAKIRIPELQELLRSDPTNSEWQRELKELTSGDGR